MLYEKKEWLRKLDRATEESDKADTTNAIREVALSLVRQNGDARDSLARDDIVGVKQSCWYAAFDAIKLVFLLNHRFARNDFWKEVFECPTRPSDFRQRLEILQGFDPSSLEELVGSLENLCRELLEIVTSRGIRITSSQLKV